MHEPPDFVTCERAGFGWYCIRRAEHNGTCYAKPRWWNLRARLWAYMTGL